MSSENATRSGRSWRDIRQEVTPRAMSRKGRRRQRLEWLKISVISAVVAGIAITAFLVIRTWEEDRPGLAALVKSAPVREFSIQTDGTLTRAWVEATLALPKGATLMELDLPALRDRLLAGGQVRTAVVTRSFPDMLVIGLEERSPVARLQVEEGLGAPKQLFVAKDGVVYHGLNYDPAMVSTLPWLDGVHLAREPKGYAPIAGMDSVATLLSTAQFQAPQLYHDWTVVSLARLAERDEIVVKSQTIPEIVFSSREDFFKQVARLDYIVDLAKSRPESGQIQSVNLALGGQVPVRLAISPAQAEKAPHLSNSNLQPNSQRKGQRDL